jgi:hypothetical protein
MAFMPEADLGIVILTNEISLAPVPLIFQAAVLFRLLELLFAQPAEFDAQLTAQIAAARPHWTLGTVDADAVAPYLGRYGNPELGEVMLSLRGERLILDTGELSSELRPRADRGGATVYLLHDPPLSLFSEAYGATLTFTGAPDARRMTLTIPANPTGPAQTFQFTPLG